MPLQLLSEKGSKAVAYFYNPNIASCEEYNLRAETFRSYAGSLDLEIIMPSWEPGEWSGSIAPFAGVFPLIAGDVEYDENRLRRERRCRACYRFRFERLAAEAHARGYGAISTTLSISPYQFIDAIEEELKGAAQRHSLEPAFVDYRSCYPESIQRSRELGMYRQSFCGCQYSQEEAELERSARKAYKQSQSAVVQDVTYG